MTKTRPLRIYMVIGEASGDALGANILSTYIRQNVEYDLAGLAGPKMQALGASSLFDISQLSVMGMTEVIGKLPGFFKLVHRVVGDAISFKPDIVVLIDSPDFNHAVAKRIKKRNPDIPIVKYICPSIWAWRQGRAKKMAGYIDHVLAILPFEPQLMEDLGGPPTTYVGHPLSGELRKFGEKDRSIPASPVNLLVLPGSRKGEVKRLLPVIRDTMEIMHRRNIKFHPVLPAVDHLADYITDQINDWSVEPEIIPEIVTVNQAKQEAFGRADVALACSGTVMLELGLLAIPTISIYKLDRLGFIVRRMVKAWTACLPNLITDKVIIPEYFEEYAHPQLIARVLETLCLPGANRDAQLEGFKLLRQIMERDAKNQDLAALKILEVAERAPKNSTRPV